MTNTVLTPVCSAVTSVGGAPPVNYVNVDFFMFNLTLMNNNIGMVFSDNRAVSRGGSGGSAEPPSKLMIFMTIVLPLTN